MEHRTSAELNGFAEVIHPQKLSKKELLERWALALKQRKSARLNTLRETEYKPVKERLALRQDNSPLRRLSGSFIMFADGCAIAVAFLAGTILLSRAI